MKFAAILLFALAAVALSSTPAESFKLPELADVVNKTIQETINKLADTVNKVTDKVQELKKKGHDLLASKMNAVQQKLQQLLDTIQKKLDGKQNYSLVDDLEKQIEKLTQEAKEKLAEAKEQGKKFVEEGKEKLVQLLDDADKQVDTLKIKMEEQQKKFLEDGDKLDAKVVEVKNKLHSLLDKLHEKYLELRQKSKNWVASMNEKKQQMFAQLKQMIQKVKARLTGKPETTNYAVDELDIESYDLVQTLSELVEQQMNNVKVTLEKLQERFNDAKGKAKDALANKMSALRSLLERLESKLKTSPEETVATYGNFGDMGEKVDAKVAEAKKNFEELKNKVLNVVDDLKAKSNELKEETKQRAHQLLDQLKTAVDGLFHPAL